MNWHTQEIEKVLSSNGSSRNGLTAVEVEKKLSEFGKNELTEKKKKPVWLLFLNQFRDFMIPLAFPLVT